MRFNLKLYIKKSWHNVLILLLTVLYGFFGVSCDPWKNWELASVVVILIYTLILYVDGFFISKRFKGLTMPKLGLFLPALATIALMLWFLINNSFHEFFPESMKYYGRLKIMGMLFLTSGILSWIDYEVGKNENICFIKIFYYSDLPVTITFLILFIYSIVMNRNQKFDPFFSGAIAFQMIISIFLWSLFTDDNIMTIEKTN